MSDSSWALVGKATNDLDGFIWGISAPQFLVMYAGWFVLLFGVVLLLRRCGFKRPIISSIGLAGYEIPAVLRMTVFAPPYMHQWGLLAIVMVLGGSAFLVCFRRISTDK